MTSKGNNLVYNAIKCPDGTILVSKHRHDYVCHTQADGREYFVDGGLAYQRIGASDEYYQNLSLYEDSPHEDIREVFTWTRIFDAEMNRLSQPEPVLLKDITDSHLDALVEWTEEGYPAHINNLFVNEKQWRVGYD